jgi:hypothetical protein
MNDETCILIVCGSAAIVAVIFFLVIASFILSYGS